MHDRCLGHRRKHPDEPCRAWPNNGSDVCRIHGASSPQAIAKATQRIEQAAIVQAARTFGVTREGVSEEQALREELSRTLGHIEWLKFVVADLEAEDVFWGRTAEETGRESGSGSGGDTARDHATIRREARLNIAVAYLMEERKHLRSLAVEMVKLGLQEREVRLEEQQGHLWASVMRAVLGDEALGLSPAQLEKAPEIVSRHLRALGAP
ncbi:MAG: hypothetical protein ABSC31_13995 [Acidimicrobiales bacterium]